VASARPSSPFITPSPGARPSVAHAHSVVATSCALNVSATTSPTASRPLISPSPRIRPSVAYRYAHSVLATRCVLNVSASASARPCSTGRRDRSPGRRRALAMTCRSCWGTAACLRHPPCFWLVKLL